MTWISLARIPWCRLSSLPTWPRIVTRHPPLNWSGDPQVDFSRRIFSGSTFATSTSIGTRADGRFRLKKTPLSENQTWPVVSIHFPSRMYPPSRSALLTGRYVGDCALNSKPKPQVVRRKTNTNKTNCDFDVIVRAASGDAAAPPRSVMKARRFTAGPSHASNRKDNTALLRCGISIWPLSLVGQSFRIDTAVTGGQRPLHLQ
jgi:hypothetical protein